MNTVGLDRATRASRGKRMSKLLNEEVDADDEFWNQDAFKEDAEDNEYEAEDEEADIFDSDFDEDEPNEEEINYNDERRPVKKRKMPPPGKPAYHEKKRKEKKERSSVLGEGVHPVKSTNGGDISNTSVKLADLSRLTRTQHQENGETIVDLDGERSVRKSTRTAVVIKQAEREAHQAALQALTKPVKRKKEEERKISQEEMLLEAAQTEIQNIQALEIMLAREEEVKRKAIIQKAIYTGPQVRFYSRDGKNVMEFTKVTEFPEFFNSSSVPIYPKVLCVITGQPAKYRDPKSDLPFATKEAFKIIRERFNKGENPGRKDPLEESHQRKRTKVERERSGPGGRTIFTKLKFKKVTNMTTRDDAVHVSRAASMEPGGLSTQQSTDPTLDEPADPYLSSTKSNLNTLQLPRNLMSHGLSMLDMPGAFLEANEADFLLDDLEVPLPSNLETGLSLPTTATLSPILLANDSGSVVARSHLEQARLDVTSCVHNQSLFSDAILQLSDLEGLESAGRHVLTFQE